MDVRILGPLEVVADGRAVALGGSKQRSVLALLILHANQVVARDRLVEELWGPSPPKTVDKALQGCISRLRRALEPEIASADQARVLVTRPPGYALELAADALDLHRFERARADAQAAAARGNYAEASDSLRTGLALWRGPPLGDLAYEPFAQTEIARLEGLRLAALEERLEADLALGRHAAVIAELESLVSAFPLHERFCAQLMLALYRSGRQADALQSYRDARRRLVDELGIDPSPELVRLEQAVLRQDSSLDWAARAVTAEPTRPADTVFVGREQELDDLGAVLDEALTQRGRVLLISGEPGIGKSTLADQIAAEGRRRGALVLVGRCWEAGGAPPFWPWVQALNAYLRQRDPGVVREQVSTGAADLAQVLPELRGLYDDLPPPPSSDPEGVRFRFFEATAAFLRRASQAQPLVLVLEDLHAADAPSLLLLQFLGGALDGSRLLVVCCYRDVDPTLRDPLAAAVADLSRRPEASFMSLGGLSESAIERFVKASTGLDPPVAVLASIRRTTGGNPLFVGEMVRLLRTEEMLKTMLDPGARLSVPEGIRAVIRSRLRHLSDDCSSLLVLAAVLGAEFSLAALEQVSRLDENRLLVILDEAARERVVADVPGTADRLRFAHALIRDSIYDELAPGRRRQLHREVGDALERLYADNPGHHLAELAHHFYESGRPVVAPKALMYARLAAERSLELLAYEEASRLFDVALRILTSTDGQDEATRCELLLRRGEAQARAGDVAHSKASFRDAAELAEALGLPEQLGRAALGYGGRLIWDASRDDPYLMPLLGRALAELGEADSIIRARLLARLAAGPMRDSTADPERRKAIAAEGLEMARRIGDPPTLAQSLAGYLGAHDSAAFTPRQPAMASEMLAIALEERDLERAIEAYEFRLESWIELGELPAAYADLSEMSRLADELRRPAQQWIIGVYRSFLALLEGRFAEAERLIETTHALGERASAWTANASHDMQLFLLRREQGRLGDVEQVIRRAAAQSPTYPILRCALTSALAELGATDAARRELDELAVDDFSGIPFDEEWSASLALLAEAAVTLGDTGRSAVLYELLLPYADRLTVSYTEISLGPVARFLGGLAAASGRFDIAARHLRDAAEFSARIGARPSLAHAQADLARLLSGHGDGAESGALALGARALYLELGMDVYADGLEALIEPGP